jgi:hypothetical protein
MGFDPRDIIAREDFLFESPTAYGGTTRTVTAVKTCPHSVLIDNLPPHEESPQLKQLFLGIKEHQYFQIREFYGAPDPECFPEELATLIKTVNKKLEELAKSPDKEINKMSPACQTTPPQQLQTYPSL